MLPDLLNRTQTLYKGDVLAGSFYLLIGLVAALLSIAIYWMTVRLGFYYLSIGMLVFALYMLGKGSVMMYMYRSRFIYYKGKKEISKEDVEDEKTYTKHRIRKKNKSRRVYLYIIVIGCAVAFWGVFQQEKGLIVGTCIPVVLMSAIEFSIGLLTEFRLSEYFKQLHR